MRRRVEGDILCFSQKEPDTWGQFAADVALLRSEIERATHVCNVLGDRYDFMVGLAAALLNGQITVLPNAAAPEAIASSLEGAARPLVLGGQPQHDLAGWRMAKIGTGSGPLDPAKMIAALETSDTPIHVFTSGTTKHPERHVKTWAILSCGAAITNEIVRILGLEAEQVALIGTTPHQHMYGLEATVFAGLQFGHCAYRTNPFFAADLDIALQAARAAGCSSVVLITSPAHLKYFEDTILGATDIRGVISATAPLHHAQAERLEARGNLPVMEIYGSTETGSLAIRRTVEDKHWRPLAGFTLEQTPDGALARAPYLPKAIPLGDSIEIFPDGRFDLLGRAGDMVSVSGKRTTLAALNAVLIETPGLVDGVVLHQPQDGDDLLAIVAVRDPTARRPETELKLAIRHQFHRFLDPVFAPRRIRFADSLPRSGTGKIPAAENRRLFELAGVRLPDPQ